MIVSVVKDLVTRHTKAELEQAVAAFETNRQNILNVEGPDDGEKLSNLLAAAEVRSRMDQGMALNDALRDFGGRVRSIFGGSARATSGAHDKPKPRG